MKNLLLKSKITLAFVTALLLCVFFSCSKKNDTAPPVAVLSVIDASPGSPSLNFFLENNRVNNGGIKYTDQLGYFNAYAGSRTAIIYNASSGAKLASANISLNENKPYSLFVTDTLKNIGFLLIPDSISAPASGHANIRFVQLGPDAPAVDLAIKGGSVLFSNKAYKSYSTFSSVKGDSTYTFEVRPTGKTTALTTLTGLKIESKKVYTIWLRGLINTAKDSLKIGASIITNAHY